MKENRKKCKQNIKERNWGNQKITQVDQIKWREKKYQNKNRKKGNVTDE